MNDQMQSSTVAAVSTPPGSGGIAVIRMSGSNARDILAKIWKGKDPRKFESHTVHIGWIRDTEGNDIDQVVTTVFNSPNSYTGEDVIEISCHGSAWIQRAILNSLIESGAEAAGPGEFTRRAFENGRIDLAQAEGVADLIAASSRASARLAASQLRGDFSNKLKILRSQLIDLGSLLELELDFSEEDVEFADRSRLIRLAEEIYSVVSRLAASYKAGNAFKSGIPVAIVGRPNAGKSTLLNYISGEEKAIVSEIAGTTRDVIEDTVELSGILFRFFDTAGIRKSEDRIENLGIERTLKKIEEASFVLCLLDSTVSASEQKNMKDITESAPESANIIFLITKKDLSENSSLNEYQEIIGDKPAFLISAATGEGIEELEKYLAESAVSNFNPERELIVTNTRHYEALKKAEAPLLRLIEGLKNNVSGDFLAQNLREAEYYLGSVTGEINSSEILHTIFSRFCIGK